MHNSERALVPLPSELAGLRAPDGQIGLPRLRWVSPWSCSALVGRRGRGHGPVRSRLRVLARPAVAFAQGSVVVARHHLDLDGWAARGLAEQRRAQAAAIRAIRR